jgi:hypothetical protein
MTDRLDLLQREILALPWDDRHFPRLLPMLEEAVPLADEAGDTWAGFWLRARLAGVCNNLDLAERALVAVFWCLSMLERDPEVRARDGGRILRSAATVAQLLPTVPTLPRQEILRLLDELERLHRRAGLPPRSVAEVRHFVLLRMGDLGLAGEAFDQWRSLPRESAWRLDCDVCEADATLEWYAAIGRDEDAIASAAALLDSTAVGVKDKCEGLKAWGHANALAPLVRLGRLDDAWSCHRRGLAMVTGRTGMLSAVGKHLGFLAAVGDLHRAVSLSGQHLALADRLTEHGRYRIDVGVWLVVCALRRHGVPETDLRIPRWHPAFSPAGRYDVAALAERLGVAVRSLALRFDTRNGNDFVSMELLREQALLGPGVR